MRKISYIVIFFVVAYALILNVVSNARSDWLVRYLDEKNVETTITYGLSRLCLLKVTQPTNATSEYMDLECRPFPSKVLDDCEKENAQFCVAWKSARYCVVLAAWCASAVLCAIVFGVSTRSRRRRIWRVVVTLLLLHALLQLVAFWIITDLYRSSRYPMFEGARAGYGYIVNVMSWTFSLLATLAITVVGISADKGRRWAIGNRGYQPICDV